MWRWQLVVIGSAFIIVIFSAACGSGGKAITAQELATAYDKDEEAANQRFAGNEISVNGHAIKIGTMNDGRPLLVLLGSEQRAVMCIGPEESTHPIAFGIDVFPLHGIDMTISGWVNDLQTDDKLWLQDSNNVWLEECTGKSG